jgi:preprotein translocase subunit YajC
MVASLKKGDEIVTSGGIIGTIVHVTDETLTVKTGENTRIVIERGRVSRKLED